jgi:CubicO group peptidase (beta-lactamase class C family)
MWLSTRWFVSGSILVVALLVSPTARSVGRAQAQRLAADTPQTTTMGATFIAPAGWSIVVRGPAMILEPPEGDSHIALIDVTATSADAAVAAAWAAYRPDAKWPLKVVTSRADLDGWQNRRVYDYETSPNERRDVQASAYNHGDTWTIVISDMSQPTAEKRLAQVVLIFNRLFPKGYHRETFAGKQAHTLDEARIAELGAFVERARDQLGLPGVAIGLIQTGKVAFAGGFGVRELGKPDKIDADSLLMIASNTKALTTLLLARLVDQGKLTWDTPVTSVLPSFKLGDAETTRQVLIRHLICACTGLPRQDLDWLMEFKNATPASALAVLGTIQPTSKFGEMFQYSNGLAAAGGYVAGHVAFPSLELGAAYDQAMQRGVFDPLGMSATTFDFARALGGNHASPHALDIDDKPAVAVMDINYAIVPVRPAGGAWSNVRDLLRYLSMELARGVLPDGARYINEGPLLARRAAQVPIGSDETYGMGLEVDSTWGIPVLHHGGSMIGYKSDMIFLPDHGVGAVILTNSDSGSLMLGPFRRKLLELLFDGRPEAETRLAAAAKSMHTQIAAERPKLTVPAAAAPARALAARYRNPALGDIAVTLKPSDGATTSIETWFDFGEWKSPVASRKNLDGTLSFVTIAPGFEGLEFVVGSAANKRTLVVRDAQHEYVFTEQ